MGIPGVPTPARLGRYELLARLATGGMGEIFLARLEGAAGFEKLYVVKRILPHLADDARFRSMLIAEARIASKMAHANICQVYELGDADGQLFIVMEHLEGIALLSLLRRSSKDGAPLDLGLIGGIVQQCTDALHYAHELRDRNGDSFGIVHRDVTPGNIFLTDAGMTKVLDFGIAKVKDASANTQTGTVKGKYAYMAPEQLRGTSIDRRADVFALGVVIYEMLALRRLFQRKTDYLTFRAVMEQPIPDVRRYRPDMPDPLAEVVARALDRDPDGRYATARVLGGAVLDALGTRPWSQGELGDYLRTHFSEEIDKRRAQTASAIQRTNAGVATRAPMPVISNTELTPQPDDDEDDSLPAVETATVDVPPEPRPPSPRPEFHGTTPPPFGSDSHASGDNIHPLPRMAQPPQPPAMVVVPRRNVVWPAFAIAMVMIAGGALFLVWRQMENQPPKQEIIITQQPIEQPAPPQPTPTAPAPVQPPDGSGSGPTATPTPPPRQPSKARTQPTDAAYAAAIEARRLSMNRCAQEHGITAPAKVVIWVTTTGRTKSVSFEPDQLNRTPMGACIKNVLSSASFPRTKEEMKVTIPIWPRGGAS